MKIARPKYYPSFVPSVQNPQPRLVGTKNQSSPPPLQLVPFRTSAPSSPPSPPAIQCLKSAQISPLEHTNPDLRTRARAPRTSTQESYVPSNPSSVPRVSTLELRAPSAHEPRPPRPSRPRGLFPCRSAHWIPHTAAPSPRTL